MKKPTMAFVETAQKPPHALTPAPFSYMNGASNLINKLPNSNEPTTITTNATWL